MNGFESRLTHSRQMLIASVPGLSALLAMLLIFPVAASAVPLKANPAQVTFYATPGKSSPSQIFVAIASSPSGSTYTVSSNQPWLAYSPASNATGGVTIIRLTASAASLTAGVYTGTVTFTSGVFTSTTTVTFNVSTPSGALTAASGSPVSVSSNPHSVAVGDFNGDGKLDFVTTGYDLNKANVMVGNGSGGFTLVNGGQFGVGTGPESVAVGDFDKDGKLDLAVVNYADNKVTVEKGNGSGSFGPFHDSPFTVGSGPSSVVVGDFNKDGNPDFATANYTGNNLTVMLGNGVGGFSPASGSPFTVGSGPKSLAVGDFDGDGDLDFAVANSTGASVTVMLGNGSGVFTQASGSPFTLGSDPESVAVGDFDGDGELDFATANKADNTVSVMLGNGSGGFTPATGSPFGVGASPRSVAVGDFNGDGRLDFATLNNTGNNITVMLGNGSGGFTQAAGSPFAAGSGPWSLAVGDFNGDGRLDLAAANADSDNVTVLLGGLAATSGTIATTAVSPVGFGTGVPLTLTLTPAVDPLNAVPAGTVTFYDGASLIGTAAQNVSPYTFTSSTLALGAHSLSAVYVGDARNAASTSNTISVNVLPGQTIAFTAVPSSVPYGTPVTLHATGGASQNPVIFTSSTTDVCTVSGTNGANVALISLGDCTVTANQAGNANYGAAVPVSQTFTVTQASQTITFGAPAGFRVLLPASAFNVSAGATSGLAVIFTSATPAICTVSGSLVTPLAVGTCTVQANQAGDANNAAAPTKSQSFTLLNAAPSGALTAASGSPFSVGPGPPYFYNGGPSSMAVGDFNNDGKLDFATTNEDRGFVAVMLGDGLGGFTKSPASPFSIAGGHLSSVAVGDFNNDGKLDFATGNGGFVAVMLGDGLGGFTNASGTSLAPGWHPGVAVGDFNGDGKLDFAAVNLTTLNVTVMLGNGLGGFSEATGSPVAVGDGPYSIAVGDFDGDGRLDFATANSTSNDVSVMLGNGSGGFSQAPGSPFSAGASPIFIAKGDFNGDGRADLAIVNGNSVSVMLGNGSGGFSGNSFAVGGSPKSVAVGDFDGDGKLDFATANSGSGNVTVMLGNGSGGFTQASGSPFAAGTTPWAAAVGDFNADGRLDLAIANNYSDDVTVNLGVIAAPTGTITTTAGSSVAYGAAVPLTLTLTPALHQLSSPTGTVTFSDGASPIGTAVQSASPYTFTPATLTPGAHSFSAVYGGDTRNTGSTSNTISVTVTQASQTILFGAAPSPAAYNTSVTVSATGGASGNPVTFTSATTGVCTVSGTNGATVALIALGTCTITANQAGNANYTVAPAVNQSFTVTQASQTITIGAPSTSTLFPATTFNLSAGASSGLPVTLSSATSAICRMSGSLVTPLAAGTCTIQANQAGNANYAAATAITRNFAVSNPVPSGALTPASGSPVGNWYPPKSVAVGDFNGDGKLDFAAASSSSNNVTVMLGNGSGGFTEASGSPFAVGPDPVSIAVGDFDADGKLDLATANVGSDNVTVMLGNGSGGFTQAFGSPFAVGSDPVSVAVGDFNGDGKLDFATANASSDNVTVMLGNGSGGFTSAPGSPFTTGLSPRCVAVGDFNSDGKLDFATANLISSNVTVMLGNGLGGFSQPSGSPFTSGLGPFGIVVGDFNGDGKLDYVTANINNATVMLGNGSGGFTQASGSPFTAGTEPASVAVGDFNGDGKLDFVTVNYTSDSLTVMLGNGSGGFTLASGSPFVVGSDPHSVAVGDFNGDGRLDFAAANYGGNGVAIWLGGLAATHGTIATTAGSSVPYGTPVPLTLTLTPAVDPLNAVPTGHVTFSLFAGPTLGTAVQNASPYTFTTSTLAAGAYTLVADYKGDTRNAASASFNYIAITVTQASQTITFGPAPSPVVHNTSVTVSATGGASGYPVTFTSATTGVCTVSGIHGSTVSLIGGGTCTITANQAGDTNYSAAVPVNQSFAVTPATQSITFGAVASSTVFVAAVFNVSAHASSGLAVTFTSATSAICTVSGSSQVTPVAAGTCTITANQTGNASYAAASPVTKSFTIVNVVPSGALTAASGDPVTVGRPPRSVAIGDFNGDGKLDFVAANPNDNTITVLLGNGSGGFTEAAGSPLTLNAPVSVTVGDFNGDGKLDFVVPTSNYSVTLMLGNGSGGFTHGGDFTAGSFPGSVTAGDFNGDGNLDLAIANAGSSDVTMLLGNGLGGFTQAFGSPFTVGSGPWSVAAGDFNGDGKLDFATANHTTNNVTVMLANGSGGFTPASGSPFKVGNNPRSVAVGDFNGDGKLDFATANADSDNVSVMLGNGSGVFAPASGSPYTVGSDPESVSVGDFNGDGKLDFATTNGSSYNVSVMLGNGSGVFTPASGSPFYVGNSPRDGAVGDFNGDGRPDFVTANNDGDVTLLLGGLAATSGTIARTGGSTVAYGTAVPLTLTLTPAVDPLNAVPTGTVTFYDGSTSLGTAAQSASPYTFSAASLIPGSHSFSAVYGGDARNAGSTSGNTVSVTVSQVTQTITFGPAPSPAAFGTSVTVSATGGASGNPVTFTSATTGTCTVSGTNGATVALIALGTCTVTANQALNTIYAAAVPVNQSFTVTQASQTIAFGAAPSPAVYNTSVTVSATGGTSGNPVTFTSVTTGVCTVSGTNGAAVALISPGTCTIRANQAGNTNYTAAAAVNQSFTVTKASQTITFGVAPSPAVFNTSVTVSATGGASGNAVTFTSVTTGICTVSGANGSTVALTSPGTCTIRANQAGNTNYTAAVATNQSFTVTQASQAITFGAAPSPAVFNTSVTVSATGGASGNPVTFASATPGVCTVSGTNGATVALIVAGTCTITANQAGNTNYTAATAVNQSFSVNKVTPVITWTNPGPIGYGTALSTTQLNATPSVPGTLTYTPAAGTFLNAGNSQTLSVSFIPTDTANYNSAAASVTINVNKATPTLTWAAPAPVTFGSALSTSQLNAGATFAGNPVAGTITYTPPVGTVLPVGANQTLSAAFTPADIVNYNGATATTNITVNAGSGSSGPANLVTTRTLTRSAGNIVVSLNIANTGGTAANNVMITTVRIGTTDTTTPLPYTVGTVGAGNSVTVTLIVPGSAGAPGSSGTLTVSGSHSAGTFTSSGRVTLP